MKIVLVTTLGKEIIPSGIVSAVLTQTAEVALKLSAANRLMKLREYMLIKITN